MWSSQLQFALEACEWEKLLATHQWRAFAWVHDWRLIHARIEGGESADPEVLAEIQVGLQRFGDQFLKDRERVGVDPGTPLPPGSYHKDWRTGHSIRQICESVGAEELYRLYIPFSDWHHWGVGGLGTAINRAADRVHYSSLRPTDTATTLAIGFQCLLQTVEVVDAHLGVGLGEKIADLRDGYIAWYGDPPTGHLDG